jgi:hypothetical protein
MSASLLQVASAHANENSKINIDPEITYFKSTFRRHTDFAIENICTAVSGIIRPGGKIKALIERKGDMVNKMYLSFKNLVSPTTGAASCSAWSASNTYYPDDVVKGQVGIAVYVWRVVQGGTSGSVEPTWTGGLPGAIMNENNIIWENMGLINSTNYYPAQSHTLYEMIDNVSIEIGGQILDKHTGKFMEIWKNLSCTPGKKSMLEQMTSHKNSTYSAPVLKIPMPFWFCDDDKGMSLPIVALRSRPVYVNIEFTNNLPSSSVITLDTDYIFLTDTERVKVMNDTSIQLIEQIQIIQNESVKSGENMIVLTDFNHPVKELIWNLDDTNHDKLDSAGLEIDGRYRFPPRDAGYFSDLQRYSYHTNSKSSTEKNIFLYSFALEPEDAQPSGSMNFSKFDEVRLELNCSSTIGGGATATVYARNYNMFQIKNGNFHLKFNN